MSCTQSCSAPVSAPAKLLSKDLTLPRLPDLWSNDWGNSAVGPLDTGSGNAACESASSTATVAISTVACNSITTTVTVPGDRVGDYESFDVSRNGSLVGSKPISGVFSF